MKEDAAKRLTTLVNFTHLWAWFELAMKDLEIRWSGEILWVQQSGESKYIWINLYIKMLEDKIRKIQLEKWEKVDEDPRINTIIDLNIGAYISDEFFNWELDKLNFYRELESLTSLQDLNNMIQDFKSLNNPFDENIQDNSKNNWEKIFPEETGVFFRHNYVIK